MHQSLAEHPLLRDLNPQQQEAVRHVHGPILILAGAGSGKTTVITRRIAWLIEEEGISPASILAMIPCLSPCCLIGLPIGIWALVILMKPEVKAAFK